MRLSLLLIVLNSAFCIAQKAEFFCPKNTFTFPETKEGVVLKHTFVIYNKGRAPFELLNCEVECSCTSVEVKETYLEPGDSSNIEVAFDSEGKVFYQDRTIKITTNIRKKPYLLRFKVKVIPKPE